MDGSKAHSAFVAAFAILAASVVVVTGILVTKPSIGDRNEIRTPEAVQCRQQEP